MSAKQVALALLKLKRTDAEPFILEVLNEMKEASAVLEYTRRSTAYRLTSSRHPLP